MVLFPDSSTIEENEKGSSERDEIANLILKNFGFFDKLDSAYLHGFFNKESEAGRRLTKILEECGNDFEKFSEQAADLLLSYRSEFIEGSKLYLDKKLEKKNLMALTGKISKNTKNKSRFSVKVLNLKDIESIFLGFKGENSELLISQIQTQRFKLTEKPDFLLFAGKSLENQENSLKISIADVLKEHLKEFDQDNIEEIVTMTGLEFKVKLKIVVSLSLSDKFIYLNERLEELTELIKIEKTKSLLFWQTVELLKLKYNFKSNKFKTSVKLLASKRGECCLIV